ncbi:hypothetical protein DFH06DRAFT_1131004 [Mycena polygramma]|nr:hypothetical protein DFH06DRAFT_1131004 [Mycena polygramma]
MPTTLLKRDPPRQSNGLKSQIPIVRRSPSLCRPAKRRKKKTEKIILARTSAGSFYCGPHKNASIKRSLAFDIHRCCVMLWAVDRLALAAARPEQRKPFLKPDRAGGAWPLKKDGGLKKEKAHNGGLINAIGSLNIAIIAKAANKPLYALAESYKFHRLFPLSQYDLPSHNSRILSFPTPIEKDYAMENATENISSSASPSSRSNSGASSSVITQEEIAKNNPDVDYTRPDLISLVFSELGSLTPSGKSICTPSSVFAKIPPVQDLHGNNTPPPLSCKKVTACSRIQNTSPFS